MVLACDWWEKQHLQWHMAYILMDGRLGDESECCFDDMSILMYVQLHHFVVMCVVMKNGEVYHGKNRRTQNLD